MMKVDVYEDSCVKGLVPRKIDPIGSKGCISLLFNGEEGFSIKEVGDTIEFFFMCPQCNSSIDVEVTYKPNTQPKIRLENVVNRVIPVYSLERTAGHICYQWRCLDDHVRLCANSRFLLHEVPPTLKPDSC